MRIAKLSIYTFTLCILLSACESKEYAAKEKQAFLTKNVVVIIMDGGRYTETWGDPDHTNIPFIAKHIAPESVVCTNFRNNGPTYTNAGHAAITTGVYAEINNSGFEFPAYPSYFQLYNKKCNVKNQHNWVITSKDKLSILANCSDPEWTDRFTPYYNSGVDGSGLGSGYRNDSLTCLKAIDMMKQHHPRLVLINFLEPDGAGHSGIWDDYVNSVRSTDRYIYEVWKFLNSDKFYRDSTAIFITNDHGRHSDGVLDGFVNHGCPCEGCRQLFFFASGPDFRKGVSIDTEYELIDIPSTIATIMDFPFPYGEGVLMKECFKGINTSNLATK